MEQLIVADTALAGFSSSCLQPDCSLLPSCISSLLSVSHFLRFPLQYWVNVCEEKVKVHEHWYLSYFTYSVCPLQVLWPWVRSKLYTTGYLTQFIVTFCLFRSLWHLVFSWPSQNHTSLQATQQVGKWSCEVDGYWRLVARRIFQGAYIWFEYSKQWVQSIWGLELVSDGASRQRSKERGKTNNNSDHKI